jgi:hypothetical protein
MENVQANLPSYFSERDTKSNIQEVYNALFRSRTYCTTLTEFHLFWVLFFDQMVRPVRQGGWDEKAAADYLRCTYFFELPSADASEQYGATNLPMSTTGVLCAAWWASYSRLQPGSACGTQPVEAFHAHVFRAAMVDERGRQLAHLQPNLFFAHFAEAVAAIGKQQRKAGPLIDRPNMDDPIIRSGAILNKIGRSTAVQLNACPDWIHQVLLPGQGGQAFVMPRSLLRWQLKSGARGAASDQGDWVPVDAGQLQCDPAMAQTIARVSVEKDGQLLLRLWKDAGIATATRPHLSTNFSIVVDTTRKASSIVVDT